MSSAPLSPLGTARRRFSGPRGLGDPAATLRFPEELVATARDRDFPEELVHLAWETARWATELSPAEQDALLLLVLASLVITRQGSTYLPAGGEHRALLVSSLEQLGVERPRIEAVVTLSARRLEGLAPVIGPAGAAMPLIALDAPGGLRLYPQRLLEAERRLAGALEHRTDRARALVPRLEGDVPRALADVLARPPELGGAPIVLGAEQQRAIAAALEEPLLVITGGPGTGKTSIVLSILRALVRLGVAAESIALAAPTGKAANRLEAAIKRGLVSVRDPSDDDQKLFASQAAPQTLHRLLGYRPRSDSFVHHEHHKIAARVVIVDEGSMIDLLLADRLFRALRDDARLILLGDADQLPSVEAGAVLRDLVQTGEARGRPAVARLLESHRMKASDEAGRAILESAALVNQGREAELLSGSSPLVARSRLEDVVFRGVEHLLVASSARRRALLDRWYAEGVRGLPDYERLVQQTYLVEGGLIPEAQQADVRRLLQHLESLRILCLTRGSARPTGADAINDALHLERVRDRGEGALWRRESGGILPGEPVLMEKNDYSAGLFNGDFGVVLRVADRDRPKDERRVVVFQLSERLALFPIDALRGDLSLAYAMTVHKAQGSEFDRLVLMLPEDEIALGTRELVYTAITRAKRSVLIAGKREVLSRAVGRRLERFSGLA